MGLFDREIIVPEIVDDSTRLALARTHSDASLQAFRSAQESMTRLALERERFAAISGLSSQMSCLANTWLERDQDSNFFETEMRVRLGEGFFRSRSLSAKIRVRRF